MIYSNRKRGPRLDPLLVQMFADKVSIKELAQRLGMTQAAVNDWFKNDDCKLSRLEQMAEALGYKLRWTLEKEGNVAAPHEKVDENH